MSLFTKYSQRLISLLKKLFAVNSQGTKTPPFKGLVSGYGRKAFVAQSLTPEIIFF